MPILDQGYQHWSGNLSSMAWRWLAIARHDMAIGLRNPLLRLFILLSWFPAIGLAFVLSVWGLLERKSELAEPIRPFLQFLGPKVLSEPVAYRSEAWTIFYEYFLSMELRFSMIVVVIVGPSLISQDLRFNALPLYFSRPVRRMDYFLGKFGAMAGFLGMVLIVPVVIAYALGLLFSLDVSMLRDTLPVLGSALAVGMLFCVSSGTLILAFSSVTRNSRFVGLMWLGMWLFGSTTVGILETVAQANRNYQQYRRIREVQTSAPRRGARDAGGLPRDDAEIADRLKRLRQELREEEDRAKDSNARPLLSFTANLSRLSNAILGTNAAWERLAEQFKGEERREFLNRYQGDRYPWTWSAGVVLGLLGASAWILNSRIRSLDRLR